VAIAVTRADDALTAAGRARSWPVAALGALLTLVAVGHFYQHGDHATLMVVTATIAPAVAVLVYGGWFWWRGPDGARGATVFAWAVGGATVVLALNVWGVAANAYGSTDIQHILIQHTSVGALGGAVAGTFAERDRTRARSRLRLIRALDSAMDGIAVLDTDETIRYANDAFADAYGAAAPSEVVGRDWRVAYPQETRDRVEDVLADLNSEESWRGTVTARRSDGVSYPQDLSMTQLDGGYVWVTRDVTEREERDQRLRVLNRVLRHNARNSLNVVLGRTRRLSQRLGDDEDVAAIEDAAASLLSASEKAREVERALDDGETVTKSLSEIATNEVERARDDYPGVAFELSGDCAAAVDERLTLALRELLGNAAEHCDADDPEVSVSVSAAPPSVAVSDNGSGIPEHEQRALDGVAETSLEHGSGIGLWLVYWLVTGTGGDVDVAADGAVVLRPGAGKN
jgi:PAS domain S-box-containing protein